MKFLRSDIKFDVNFRHLLFEDKIFYSLFTIVLPIFHFYFYINKKVLSRPAEGYPIDSYYLMDFSYSMKDDLENLKLLAGNLTEEFRRVSEDFTIGMHFQNAN